MHFGEFGEIDSNMPNTFDANGNKDLYKITTAAFQQLWYVIMYVVCMIAIAFHLSHGFASAFQSMGFNHNKYNPIVKKVGAAFGILIPLAFAIIPVVLYLR